MMNIEDFYLLLAFFLIYSFLGWCVEVAYHAVTFGKVVNRGFLNGPVCPIYGFGILAVIVKKRNPCGKEEKVTGNRKLTVTEKSWNRAKLLIRNVYAPRWFRIPEKQDSANGAEEK